MLSAWCPLTLATGPSSTFVSDAIVEFLALFDRLQWLGVAVVFWVSSIGACRPMATFSLGTGLGTHRAGIASFVFKGPELLPFHNHTCSLHSCTALVHQCQEHVRACSSEPYSMPRPPRILRGLFCQAKEYQFDWCFACLEQMPEDARIWLINNQAGDWKRWPILHQAVMANRVKFHWRPLSLSKEFRLRTPSPHVAGHVGIIFFSELGRACGILEEVGGKEAPLLCPVPYMCVCVYVYVCVQGARCLGAQGRLATLTNPCSKAPELRIHGIWHHFEICEANRIDTVLQLIKMRADCEALNRDGNDAVLVALQFGHFKLEGILTLMQLQQTDEDSLSRY